jgi:hypothetical protein
MAVVDADLVCCEFGAIGREGAALGRLGAAERPPDRRGMLRLYMSWA